MCSELDNESVSSTQPSVSEDKHITFQQGTNDTMSESEDDDIGSEELMCNENIDVNDKESDDSDEEELTNRVFPQQRFSPVPFAARRSQTPDIGKIRYSPIAFPAKRAVTPNIYEQMIGKGHSRELSDISSSKPPSKMDDFGFREPKGLPHSNRNSEKSESATSLSGQFVRPKLPTTKSNSPGLTVSGYFQPTGSVFRPSQPFCSSATSKFPPSSKSVSGSTDPSFSQPAMFPSHIIKFSSGLNVSPTTSVTGNPAVAPPTSPFRSSSHGGVSRVPFQHQKELVQSNAGNAPSGYVSTTDSSTPTVPIPGQPTWPVSSAPTSLAPLMVSVGTPSFPPFHQSVKGTPALSPGPKGGHLKAIAPLLSPPFMATSPSGLDGGDQVAARVLLAKKPAPLSGLVVGQSPGKRGMVSDVKQGFPSPGGMGYYNVSPVTLSTNQGMVPPRLQSPTPLQSLAQAPPPRPARVSPRPAAPSPSQLSPKGAKFFTGPCANADRVTTSTTPPRIASHTGTPASSWEAIKTECSTAVEAPLGDQTVSAPVDAQATQKVSSSADNGDLKEPSKGQVNSRPILKRFIADGMEE